MILSIQSHVAYGYVGNKAACFPLQSLGYDVCPVNTVQFSNHTGYGKWQGEIFSANHIEQVIHGIKNLGVMDSCKAVLSGYLGDSSIGEIILLTVQQLRQNNPKLIYLCDPVIGDVGRGVFVKEGIADFFKNHALSNATIITPNHFEAELLCGFPINTIEDAKAASAHFHKLGIKIFIITSFRSPDLPADKMHVFLSDGAQCLLGQTPLVDFSISPNGTGDLFSALMLGHYLSSFDVESAFKNTLQSIYYVIQSTGKMNKRELDVIGHDYKNIGYSSSIFVETV